MTSLMRQAYASDASSPVPQKRVSFDALTVVKRRHLQSGRSAKWLP